MGQRQSASYSSAAILEEGSLAFDVPSPTLRLVSRRRRIVSIPPSERPQLEDNKAVKGSGCWSSLNGKRKPKKEAFRLG